MNFDQTEDQKMLVETAASFAKKSSPVERFRKFRFQDPGYDLAVWKQMGELGWLGIPFDEDVGGFGGRFVDAALVIEQLGKTLVPEPYLASVVLGGLAVHRIGSAEQQKRLLAPMIEGDSTLALAWAESGSGYDMTRVACTAERKGKAFTLSGEKRWVLAGHAAEHLVVLARSGGADGESGGLGLFVVSAQADGVTVESVQTMDGHRAAMVRLDGVEVAQDDILGDAGDAAEDLRWVLDCGIAASCAEGVGNLQATLDMTVEYLKTREQFGTRIGTFQALQHRAVDMFVELETCRSMGIEASLRIDEGTAEERASAVCAAAVQLCRGGRFISSQAIQLHGGIGITEEHDIGLYFKRFRVLTQLFGSERSHLLRYAGQPAFAGGDQV